MLAFAADSVGRVSATASATGSALKVIAFLKSVADAADYRARETNRAFVLMPYFGYLRRNPNDPPDLGQDFQGYNFWLNKLNGFGGTCVRARCQSLILS